MNRVFFATILILGSLSLFAQKSDTTVNRSDIGLSGEFNDTTIYTEVDSVAGFPGGRQAWNKYIEKTLDAAVGLVNGAGIGKYNVAIQFTVTKDGYLKDFVPITKHKHGFEEEVIRVLKLSPKWIPAKKNGVNVNSTTEQLQVFVIERG